MKFKFLAPVAAFFLALAVQAQTTAFTYQGRLNSGSSQANGNYDFRFRLLDVNLTVVAGPVTNAPVWVTNGLFTATVDFGTNAAAFDGSFRQMEIAVRGSTNLVAYTPVFPFQPFASSVRNSSTAARTAAGLVTETNETSPPSSSRRRLRRSSLRSLADWWPAMACAAAGPLERAAREKAPDSSSRRPLAFAISRMSAAVFPACGTFGKARPAALPAPLAK